MRSDRPSRIQFVEDFSDEVIHIGEVTFVERSDPIEHFRGDLLAASGGTIVGLDVFPILEPLRKNRSRPKKCVVGRRWIVREMRLPKMHVG